MLLLVIAAPLRVGRTEAEISLLRSYLHIQLNILTMWRYSPKVGGIVSVVVEVTRSGGQRQRTNGDTIYSAGRGLWFVGSDNGNTE